MIGLMMANSKKHGIDCNCHRCRRKKEKGGVYVHSPIKVHLSKEAHTEFMALAKSFNTSEDLMLRGLIQCFKGFPSMPCAECGSLSREGCATYERRSLCKLWMAWFNEIMLFGRGEKSCETTVEEKLPSLAARASP